MKKLNVTQSIGLMVFAIIIGLCLGVVSAKADDRHHHGHHESTINNYSVLNKYVNSNGLAAVGAMIQIHPSENISGLQIGGGISQVNGRTGGALGAAFNFQGIGLISGSVAKEGDQTILGAGFNFSIKP